MSELSHFCFVSVFLRGTDLQIKQEASHRDAESGDGLALSVNLVETFRNKFHERQETYEIPTAWLAKTSELCNLFFGAMDPFGKQETLWRPFQSNACKTGVIKDSALQRKPIMSNCISRHGPPFLSLGDWDHEVCGAVERYFADKEKSLVEVYRIGLPQGEGPMGGFAFKWVCLDTSVEDCLHLPLVNFRFLFLTIPCAQTSTD